MKFKFQIIGSSSGGNCALLSSDAGNVLIDAGFTGKKIKDSLKTLGLTIGDIDAVFFTHEHRDHTAGVTGLSSASHLRFFANRATAQEIEYRYKRTLPWVHFNSGDRFAFRDMNVTTFAIPHDSQDAVGYAFEIGGEKLVWLTDCGKITTIVKHNLADADHLVIESNYDPVMLNRSDRPEDLKNRIRGTHGHLSNAQCAEFLNEYENPRLQNVFFAHISRECNTPDLVRETSLAAVKSRCARAVPVNPAVMLAPEAGFGF